MTKDYRTDSSKAESLNAERILSEVICNIDADSPPWVDADEMRPFLESLHPAQAAAYSAWMAHSFVVVGGLFHIFEVCSKPMVEAAIRGYAELGEPKASAMLKEACLIFPDGEMPEDHGEAYEYLGDDGNWSALSPEVSSGQMNQSRSYEDFFDFDGFLSKHRDAFVR